jgi:hypothetical protein
MDKINEKQTIIQTSIRLKDVDSNLFKKALIDSGFIDVVQTEETLSNLVQICFLVDDFLIEIEENSFDKSLISCFFKGYYDVCKQIYNSKKSITEIDGDELKSLIADSRMYGHMIEISGLLGLYGAMLILFEAMLKNEYAEAENNRKIISLVTNHNHFFKLILSEN